MPRLSVGRSRRVCLVSWTTWTAQSSFGLHTSSHSTVILGHPYDFASSYESYLLFLDLNDLVGYLSLACQGTRKVMIPARLTSKMPLSLIIT